ncbi:hypothetical protein [Acidihalobacter yilgarnensis]|nr:hypothetical protein [Acidihalobacter yilgarnensis]
MDVRTLAPALLAFGDLCEETGKLLYGDAATTRVEVKASFRTGSFGIDLTVTPQLMQQLMGWMHGNTATAIVNGAGILGIIGASGKGLIFVLRWLKNRRIKRIETTPDGRRILTEDGDEITVEEAVILLLRSREIRSHLQRMIDPIERDGIDTVSFGTDDKIDVVIERKEASYFHVPPPEDSLIGEENRVIPFSIISLSFKEENKWRLYDGQSVVYVTIGDTDFLDRVNKNLERFAKGDILIADTKITHWQTAEGLRTEYTILLVTDHRPGAAQINLPID